ncbi:MAG: protein kinase [Deltaproteobacteria bacterium]|nr:protein kinase [Deltaproteobacteria bacterium]
MNAITCAGCQHAYADSALFCPNCGRPKVREAVGDALVGKLLGERFQVQELIGQGGSGTIYRAEHVTLRRRVAIKVLHDELSRDDLAVERFRREATTVAEIDNEHIVEIHDFGRTPDGRLYLAMELLEGETLDAVLAREGKLSIERTADILIQVGEALMEAHAIGYVHRDLRPRNVYLANRRGKANFVKLLDFGLSKLVETDASAASTSLGMTFGDPRYMSPEQARGDRIDRRADIYQLGCVAYEVMTGAPPFSGSRVFDILTKQVTEAPAPLPTRRPGVPLWMEAAVAKMLAKDPENRFATTTRMVEALRRGLETGEVMEDEVARRRESIPPPSVSRVMQKMGLALPEMPVPAAPVTPAPVAKSAAETRPMPTAVEKPPVAAPSPAPDSKTTQRGLPAAKTPDSVELLRKRTGTPRVGVPVSAALPIAAEPSVIAEPDGQQPVAGVIVSPRPAKARPADDDRKDRDDRDDRDDDRDAADDHADDHEDDHEDDDDARETRLAAPRAKRPTGSRPRKASWSGGFGEDAQDDAPRARDQRRDQARDEKAVSQVWYDEGDAGSEASEAEPARRRARKSVSPSTTDLSFYDEVPRRRNGPILIGVVGLLLVGGIVFAMTRGGNDKGAPAKNPVAEGTAPQVVVDAAPSTVIEGAEATPEVKADAKDAKDPNAKDPNAKDLKPTGKTPATAVVADRTPAGKTPRTSDPTGIVVPGGDEIRRFPGKDPTPLKDPTPPAKDPAGTGSQGVSGRDGPLDPYNQQPDDGAHPEKKAEFFASLGAQQLSNGDTVNAAQNFKKAIDLNPNNVVAIIGQGEIALRQGALGDAIAHLNKASRFAKSARIFTLLGEAYLSSGNNTEAAANFKKALQLDPDNARARDGYNEASAKVPPPTDD